MPGRSAATWMGIGDAGGRVSLNPCADTVSPFIVTRSPANADLRNAIVSRTLVTGRSNRPPFQSSTMGREPDPTPRQKRPGAISATPAALIASVAGPRVKTLAMAEPTRIPVACPTTASGEKMSTPSTSSDHASV